MPLANNLYTHNNYKAALNYSATKRIICQVCKRAAMNCWTETAHVARDGLLQACTRFSFTYFLYLVLFLFLECSCYLFLCKPVTTYWSECLTVQSPPFCPPPHPHPPSDRIEQRHQNDEFGSSWMWTWSSNISKNLLLPLLREMLRCGVV